MELEEWEFLPDADSFLELGHEAKRDVVFKELIVDMNYFICPSLPLVDRKLSPSSSAPLAEEAQKKELVEEFKDITVVLPAAIAVDPHRHDVVTQVFFKKLTDNEFVDMKVESPRGATLTHLEPEGKEEEEEEEKEEAEAEGDRKGDGCEPMNTWNRRLVGVGAFCSLGAAAAATAFMFVLGGRHLQSQQHSHRIQFCIYSDDKRSRGTTTMMLLHRATRPNQAHISFGGYCATA
ncbi:uncharacterized protein LOC141842299 [Curcuma longa]|uniref:uncharacterized protein LOC141842299 n=1 Tax=Curcuma longa TaxID=136217 RepID=UPI003D9DE048